MLSKRRRTKRTRLQGRTLTVSDTRQSMEQKDVYGQLAQEMRVSSGSTKRGEVGSRRCGKCAQPGHNARTCGQ